MKFKLKAKAILGAAAVMIGMFAPTFSANANPLHDAVRQGKTDKEIISLAKLHPEWTVEEDDSGCKPLDLLRVFDDLRDDLFRIEHSFVYPLHDAVERGDKGTIELLLEEDPTLISKPDGDGKLPIFCVKGVATLEFLYSHGADLNSVSEDSYHTPLMLEVRFEPRLVKFLLENGADFNARDKNGQTVLHYLFHDLCYHINCEHDNCSAVFDAIDILMKDERVKQLINSVDNKGYTPLDILYEYMLLAEDMAAGDIKMDGIEASNRSLRSYSRFKLCIKRFQSEYDAQLYKHKTRGCAMYNVI